MFIRSIVLVIVSLAAVGCSATQTTRGPAALEAGHSPMHLWSARVAPEGEAGDGEYVLMSRSRRTIAMDEKAERQRLTVDRTKMRSVLATEGAERAP